MEDFRCLPSFEYCMGRNSALRLLKLKVNDVERRQYPFRNSKDSALWEEGKLWECKIPAKNNAAIKEMSTSGVASWDPAVILSDQFVSGEDNNETKELCLEKTVVCKLQYKSFSHHLPLRTVHQRRALPIFWSQTGAFHATLRYSGTLQKDKGKLVRHLLPLSLIEAVLSPSDD